MGRRRRIYLPGGVFHIAARTLRKERLFTPAMRTAVIQDLADELLRIDARLLAVAVMSNHFHLVVQQGERPLDRLMQPLLRRLALRVQRRYGRAGPVFWRPYASELCQDPEHVRNAIVYVHLNPVRAGVCDDPSRYPWTTHTFYCDDSPAPSAAISPLAGLLDPGLALPLFASGGDRSHGQLCAAYHELVEWRMQTDDARRGEGETGEAEIRSRPPSPGVEAGWADTLSPLFHVPPRNGAWPDSPSYASGRPDMATVAFNTLAAERPGLPIELVKGRWGGREYARLRHILIRRLGAAGFQQAKIAAFMRLSPSAVSKVLCTASRTDIRRDKKW